MTDRRLRGVWLSLAAVLVAVVAAHTVGATSAYRTDAQPGSLTISEAAPTATPTAAAVAPNAAPTATVTPTAPNLDTPGPTPTPGASTTDTAAPTPSPDPTAEPTSAPMPSPDPTAEPTSAPMPSPDPTAGPSSAPTPSPDPTVEPTPAPTAPPDPTPQVLFTMAGRGPKVSGPIAIPEQDSRVQLDYAFTCKDLGVASSFKVSWFEPDGSLGGVLVSDVAMRGRSSTAFDLDLGGPIHLEIDSVCKWQVTLLAVAL